MCMLFIKPKGLTLPKPYFESLQAHNADGVSCYNLETGELFQTLDYNEARDFLANNHDSQLVVHFRYGTSGEKSIEQLHGWKILNDRYTFFHNGMLTTFKGDPSRGLSDTQQLIEMFDCWEGASIEDIIFYLEDFESKSRFLIIDNETKEVLMPKCAQWANPIMIEGKEVQFSNTYAIDWHLQQDNGHLKPIKFNSMENLYIVDYDDEDDITDAERDMLSELSFIIQECSLKDLVHFITVNPETTALYLKSEFA